jgi:hypothetical protein
MPTGEKYLAVYEGGDHMVFGGHKLAGRRPETARDVEIQQLVKSSTLAFWDATLKRQPDAGAWLKNGFKTKLSNNDVFETK